jgi:hypothetical protein
VSKVGTPVSDTIYYYRHTFTVITSLIVIFLVTFYGNNTLHAFLPFFFALRSLIHMLGDNIKMYIRDNEDLITIIQDRSQLSTLLIISGFHKRRVS